MIVSDRLHDERSVIERDGGMEIPYGKNPQPVEVAGREDGDAKMQVSLCRVTRSGLDMTNRSPNFFSVNLV